MSDTGTKKDNWFVALIKHKRMQGLLLAAIGAALTIYVPAGQLAGITFMTTGLGWAGYGAVDAAIKNKAEAEKLKNGGEK